MVARLAGVYGNRPFVSHLLPNRHTMLFLNAYVLNPDFVPLQIVQAITPISGLFLRIPVDSTFG